jgi:serine/threonine-protein kinase
LTLGSRRFYYDSFGFGIVSWAILSRQDRAIRTQGAQVDDNLPRKFGKYTLIRHLATGGMAEIYLALHRSIQGFEKLVVIKRILPQFCQKEKFIQMFLAEARIAATLNHPNIIQIFDVGSVGGDYFIAMEYVNGEDLRSIVGQMRKKAFKSFPLELALGITRGLLKGLGYAHDHKGLDGEPLNIVHRDISPQNTIVTFQGEVKIVDFGIASAALKEMNSESKEESGALRGKFPYMSPEQCRGRDLDRRSDLFSVAIMLFELTTGRRLFKGKNEMETLSKIVEKPYPKPSDLRKDYPPDLERIVMKGLERERDDRYADAREMLEDIEEYIRNHRVKASALEMSRFMEDLFEEKLAIQREQMKEGKKLADIIAEQEVQEITDEDFLDMTNLPHSAMTPGGRSVDSSQVSGAWMAPQAKKRTSPAIFAVIGVLVLVVGGLGAFVGFSVIKARKDAAQRIGVLDVRSTPEGGSVWIDGEKHKGQTPIAIDGLKVGVDYKVKVTADGYKPFEQTVQLTAQNPKFILEASLDALAAEGDGVVKITVEPRTAVIIFDGKKLDKEGQATITGVKPGVPHSLLVQDPEHEDFTDTIRVKAGEVKKLDISLTKRPLGQDEYLLVVTSDPEGASVQVDGEQLEGVTPFKMRLEYKKAVEVVVQLAKYKSETKTINPVKGEPYELSLSLSKKKKKDDEGGGGGATSGAPGKLVMNSEPWANVTIAGVGKFVTPFSTSLPPGKYKVTLANPGGLSKNMTVVIGPGETVRKKVTLQ